MQAHDIPIPEKAWHSWGHAWAQHGVEPLVECLLAWLESPRPSDSATTPRAQTSASERFRTLTKLMKQSDKVTKHICSHVLRDFFLASMDSRLLDETVGQEHALRVWPLLQAAGTFC